METEAYQEEQDKDDSDDKMHKQIQETSQQMLQGAQGNTQDLFAQFFQQQTQLANEGEYER